MNFTSTELSISDTLHRKTSVYPRGGSLRLTVLLSTITLLLMSRYCGQVAALIRSDPLRNEVDP
jgi:hypothetical protein